MERRRPARRNDVPLQADATLLEEFLRPAGKPKGIHTPGVGDLQAESLRTHKIHRLSAEYGQTIYAVEIEGDLRVVFYIEGDIVVTVDIGSHDVYRG